MSCEFKILFAAIEFIMVFMMNFLTGFCSHDDTVQFTFRGMDDVTGIIDMPRPFFKIGKFGIEKSTRRKTFSFCTPTASAKFMNILKTRESKTPALRAPFFP